MSGIKLFDRWEFPPVKVLDPGLNGYINLKPIMVPRSHGRHARQQFYKSNINLVERLMNHLMVPGHRGRKHNITSGRCTGKSYAVWKIVIDAFSIIERKTKKNPVEVLVGAVENGALREEITSFRIGGIVARKAVITSPQRRIDIFFRLIAQAAYKKSVGSKASMASNLAEELIACYEYNSQKSVAIKEKERIEREAQGAR